MEDESRNYNCLLAVWEKKLDNRWKDNNQDSSKILNIRPQNKEGKSSKESKLKTQPTQPGIF